jgi:hypothetical protein
MATELAGAIHPCADTKLDVREKQSLQYASILYDAVIKSVGDAEASVAGTRGTDNSVPFAFESKAFLLRPPSHKVIGQWSEGQQMMIIGSRRVQDLCDLILSGAYRLKKVQYAAVHVMGPAAFIPNTPSLIMVSGPKGAGKSTALAAAAASLMHKFHQAVQPEASAAKRAKAEPCYHIIPFLHIQSLILGDFAYVRSVIYLAYASVMDQDTATAIAGINDFQTLIKFLGDKDVEGHTHYIVVDNVNMLADEGSGAGKRADDALQLLSEFCVVCKCGSADGQHKLVKQDPTPTFLEQAFVGYSMVLEFLALYFAKVHDSYLLKGLQICDL